MPTRVPHRAEDQSCPEVALGRDLERSFARRFRVGHLAWRLGREREMGDAVAIPLDEPDPAGAGPRQLDPRAAGPVAAADLAAAEQVAEQPESVIE